MAGGEFGSYRGGLVGEKHRWAGLLGDAVGWQERVRDDFLARNAGTAFGRVHGFAGIRSVDDFRAAVPLRSYAEFEPWITRSAEGELGVLTAEEPRVFFTTSGSTGARKRIPVTPRFLSTTYVPFFRAAMGVLAEYFPEALARGSATLNLRHDRLARPARTGSGRASLGPSQVDLGDSFQVSLQEPGSDAPWASLPVEVEDSAYLDKLYLRVRMAAEHDVRCVIGHNPAMLAMLPYLLGQWWPSLLKDIHDGTYQGAGGGTPNRARAVELERAAAYHGELTPAVIWPRISVLYCWTSGVASLYVPRLREAYGRGVTVLPAPSVASEGPVGVPLDRHPTAGALAVSTALYEFVEAEEEVRADSDTLLFDELEVGRDYHVVFSHVGGLYRYVLGDVVHVVDRVQGVPRVEYAGRGTLLNTAGERLREFHLVRALRASAFRSGLDVHNATCRVEEGEDGTRGYLFAVAPHLTPFASEAEGFARCVEEELARIAPHYRKARAAGALAAARVRFVAPEAFAWHWHRRLAAGMRPPEIKDQIHQSDPAAWQALLAH